MRLVEELFGPERGSRYHGRYAFRPESRVVETTAEFVMLKVHDLEAHCAVTLKVYRIAELPEDSQELAKAMWQAEVRILSQLVPYQWRRPGLVQFIEAGFDEGSNTLFVVWEDAYRWDLQKLLDAPSVAPPELERLEVRISLLVMLCEALFELHGHGIIHRQIHPANICVWDADPRRKGAPRAAFTQFGMSAFLNSFLWATSPEQFKPRSHTAALRYAASERLAFLSGNPGLVDAGEDYRQDFYSLGLAFIEWFAGKIPDDEIAAFLNDQGYDAYAHMEWLQGPLADRVRTCNISTDEDLANALKDLLLTMVAFQPSDRMQAASQLLSRTRDLRQLVRRRSFAELTRRPFKLMVDANTTASHLDIARPRDDGQPWTRLRPDDLRREVIALISSDLQGTTIRVGRDTNPLFRRAERSGTERWLLRGRSHLYRLEVFTDRQHGVCPWLAYVYQVVHGAYNLEEMVPVPFTDIRVIPLHEASQHVNRGHPPPDVGNWATLLSALSDTQGGEVERNTAHEVMLEAFDEIVAIQRAEPDMETFAVTVHRWEPQRDAPSVPARLGLVLNRAANQRLLEGHPYAEAFEGTRSARPIFEDWADRLQRVRPAPRLQVARDLAGLRQPAGRTDAIFESVEELEGERIVWIAVPPTRNAPEREAVVRIESNNDETIQRQAKAVEELREDLFLLDLLVDPGPLNVPLPGGDETWRTLDDPDENKREAVAACLRAHPLYVIQGPPGTGKTVTATEIVAQILATNPASRILVCAQANEALDNLVGNVIDGLEQQAGLLLLRVPSGKHSPSDPEIRAKEPGPARDRLLDTARRSCEGFIRSLTHNRTVDDATRSHLTEIADEWTQTLSLRHSEFERLLYQASNLVFGTCVGITRVDRHNVERFDWVVVEEAARANATELAIPLLRANRRLLIGDHLQLEPYKQDVFKDVFEERVKARIEKRAKQALAENLPWDTRVAIQEIGRSDRFLSLFSHLFVHAVARQRATLTACYRMHPQICELVDRLFYRDPDDPEQAVLTPSVSAEDRAHPFGIDGRGPAWMANRSILWLDTSEHRFRGDIRAPGEFSQENPLELHVIDRLLSTIAPATDQDIMLLTVYRRQQERLARLAQQHTTAFRRCRALTVMASQGKEADVVIVSLVRSNSAHTPALAIGEIRKDSALNVALSRAKRLLILVGDREHFRRLGADDHASRIGRLVDLVGAWPDREAATRVHVRQPTDLVPRDYDPAEMGEV